MLSLIIPTRNRSNFLSNALESVLLQDFSFLNFEVLIIDNGSTDDTARIADNFISKLPNARYIYASAPGLHVGRHAGIKAAKGDILVFADDDIEALPTWLSHIHASFQDPQVAMVGGNNYPSFQNTPPEWLKQMWNRPTFSGYKSIPSLSIIEFTKSPRFFSPYQIWGCNFAIRKEVLLQAGGFHPDGMPNELIRFRGDGETHVSRYVAESGLKCVFNPGASVYHKVTAERMTHNYFRQRGFNQGVSDSYTDLRQGGQLIKSTKRPLLIKRVLGFILRETLNLFDSDEAKRAVKVFQLGYHEGYTYHQACYRDDPEVRAWVHQPTYF